MTVTPSPTHQPKKRVPAWHSLTPDQRSRRVAEASLQASVTVMIAHPEGRDTFAVSLIDTLIQICADRGDWAPTWSAERHATTIQIEEGTTGPVTIMVDASCSIDWIAKNLAVALAVGDTVTLQLPSSAPDTLMTYLHELRRLLPHGTLTTHRRPQPQSGSSLTAGIAIGRGLQTLEPIIGNDQTLHWAHSLAPQYLDWTHVTIPFSSPTGDKEPLA